VTTMQRLITEIEAGGYVETSKLTLGQWVDQWIEAGAPGRRRKKVSQRSLERYGQLLRTHVKPVLGNRLLQKPRAPEIDTLYANMAEAKLIAPRTQHHVHTVFGACLATAHRKGLISANPMVRVEQVPAPEDFDPDEETDESARV
jgi:integrase